MKTTFTKKIVLSAIITLSLFSAANAQVAYDDQQYSNNQDNQQYQQQYQQPAQAPVVNDQQNFYYYPDANVYFDPSCNRYIYNNGGSWLTVNVLPSNIYIGNSPRYMVYHRGPQVWLDNAIHYRNFYRPAYDRRPIVAYNNFRREDFGRRDFAQRNFDHRDFRSGNFNQRGFNQRGGFNHGDFGRGGNGGGHGNHR